MESLIKLWSKLSLNVRERGGLCLTEERSSTVFIIIAKFLTKRALNTEVIIRTFNSI